MPIYQTITTKNRAIDTSLPHGMSYLVTTERTLYKFDELDERAQEKALELFWDLNVDYDWWDTTYRDAASIGLRITGFDFDHRNTISGKLTDYMLDSCKLIRENHGRECETFKTAKDYLNQYIAAFVKWREIEQSSEVDDEFENWKPIDFLEEFKWTDEAREIEEEYRKALLEDYLSILREEYDYLTSEENIKESIRANDYLFTEYGTHAI